MGTLDWFADNAWNIINSAAIVGTLYVAAKALRVQRASQRHAIDQTTPKLKLRALSGRYVNRGLMFQELQTDERCDKPSMLFVLEVSNIGAVPVRLHDAGVTMGKTQRDQSLKHAMTARNKDLPQTIESDYKDFIVFGYQRDDLADVQDIWVELIGGGRQYLGPSQTTEAVAAWRERCDRSEA